MQQIVAPMCKFDASWGCAYRFARANGALTQVQLLSVIAGGRGTQFKIALAVVPFAVAKAAPPDQPAHGFSPRPMRSDISA
jgi:hypothetical protein